MSNIEGISISKTEKDVYYFNYKSLPNQTFEKMKGEEEIGIYSFFETEQNIDAIAGFAYLIHNADSSKGTATITFQGIINFDEETVQVIKHTEPFGSDEIQIVLDETQDFSNARYPIQGKEDISAVKQRLDDLTKEWNIKWESNQILNNELKEV